MRERSTSVVATVYEFGDFRLDSGRCELSRAGRSLKLERKPMELLILLAAREGDLVTRAEIIERLWGSEVFVDTEHGINTAIRKIRQTLRDDPENPRFVQTVTGRGYRFVGPIAEVHPPLAARSSPPALASQPEAMAVGAISVPTAATTESSAVAENPRRRSHGHLWQIIGGSAAIVLLTLAVTLRAHWSHSRPARSATGIQSIAVLPLDNLSGDPAQNYFADGMTDELTTMLAKDSTLRVVSRTSAMQFRDPQQSLREVAGKLGVDGIVEGSISRADGKVHMTAQLIDARTDTHVWADSYDRGANDAVTLSADTAQAIAKRLNSSVPVKAARYVNPEAHDAYLRGHYFWMVGRNEDAGKYFQQAVQIQPDYAAGWAGLSEYYGFGALNGDLDPRVASPKSETAARKAVELDDSLPQAHDHLGVAIFINRWDGTQALKEISHASELDPQYFEAYHMSAKILCALGRYDEANAAQKQATAVDPIEHPGARAEIFLCARQYDAAINDGRLRLEDFPAAADVLSYLADSYHWKGMDKEAVEMLAREFTAEHNPQLAAVVRSAFRLGGYSAVARCQLADLEKQARSRRISPVALARFHAMLGEREQTIALLEQALGERAPILLWIQTDPAYDFLHKDERYRSIIRKIGLPLAW